jgi:hypothetical protein
VEPERVLVRVRDPVRRLPADEELVPDEQDAVDGLEHHQVPRRVALGEDPAPVSPGGKRTAIAAQREVDRDLREGRRGRVVSRREQRRQLRLGHSHPPERLRPAAGGGLPVPHLRHAALVGGEEGRAPAQESPGVIEMGVREDDARRFRGGRRRETAEARAQLLGGGLRVGAGVEQPARTPVELEKEGGCDARGERVR